MTAVWIVRDHAQSRERRDEFRAQWNVRGLRIDPQADEPRRFQRLGSKNSSGTSRRGLREPATSYVHLSRRRTRSTSAAAGEMSAPI